MADNKVALVTGATSGIGRATAIGLSKAGFRLVICGRRADRLDDVAEACGDALAIPCDVSDAGDVGKMFMRIREERGLTVLFISHDLGVVRRVCESAVVMRRGEIVEQGPTDRLLTEPQHPYTQLLIDSVPRPDWAGEAPAA